MRLTKINKILNGIIFKTFSSASHLSEQLVTKKPLTNLYDQLPEEYQAKILYSSYLESFKPSFKEQIKNDRIRLKEEKNLRNQRNKVVQFPVILKSFIPPEDEEEPKANLAENTNFFTEEKSEKGNFVENWMENYEFYQKSDNCESVHPLYGTADSTVASSKVPCFGCGSHLHCNYPNVPGYIPFEIFNGRSKIELKRILCQRCHFLKHYNIALDVSVTPETYIETISSIKNDYALAVLIVDLLDFPGSIWPQMPELLGHKRPIIVVGNKVDLLPRDSVGYLDYIKKCLRNEIVKSGFDSLNIKNINLISAKTGYGIEELITQLQKIWKHNGNVYLVGCTNVGKSSLFNTLLNSDYCRLEASDLVKKAITCPWPGTTLKTLKFPIMRPSEIRIYYRYKRLVSERGIRSAEEKLARIQATKTGDVKVATLRGHIGRTYMNRKPTLDSFSMAQGVKPIESLDEKKPEILKSHWCFDTPGVMKENQIQHLLTTEELLLLEPTEIIAPRGYRIKPGMSIFLSGVARLDFLEADEDVPSIKLLVYSSHNLPIVITQSKDAENVYSSYLGSEIFGIPSGDQDRLSRWPGLTPGNDTITITGEVEHERTTCDILFSSAGWMGMNVPFNKKCIFRAWTPFGKEIYVRSPALIPRGSRLCGKKMRDSIAYYIGKPFTFRK